MKDKSGKQTKKLKGSYWMINTRGMIVESPKKGYKAEGRQKFGNYFKTKKQVTECKKRMIKLFKRIKSL